MSIACAIREGYVISHSALIEKMYEEVHAENRIFPLRFQNYLFKIETPYKTDENIKRKKRKFGADEDLGLVDSELSALQSSFSKLREAARNVGLLCASVPDTSCRNCLAKEGADSFYRNTASCSKSFFMGSSNLDYPSIRTVYNENYVFPEKCTFYCYDIELIQEKLVPLNVKYDFILLDPPWWNKYIRRKKLKSIQSSYKMMYNENVKNIPVPSLLAEDGLVGVWCTNSQQNLNFLLEDIFPAWGLKYIGKWIWVKVTQSGEPVCAFAELPRKQPYERLLFACFSKESSPRHRPLPEDGKLLVSVPSAIHSHKPPLTEVLSSFLPAKPNCLELFARYLLPHWTSWGNEVLRLQHSSLYEQCAS